MLPEQFGYFLDRTWRMHPALTRAVSACPTTTRSARTGQPRVACSTALPQACTSDESHISSMDSSIEEAKEVVRLAREVLDKPWRPSARSVSRSLAQSDLIVVAPYNAQIECICRELAEAGLSAVEVGTVGRFQGREAAVAIYSTTVANLALRPQGADFLLGRNRLNLGRNRLNVAISRAQWAAYIVHARRLTDFAPRNEQDAAALSRFLRLLELGVRPNTSSERAVGR